MSITDLYIEAGEIQLIIDMHQERIKSWQKLSRLADNAEVAKVCLDHAHAHAQYREMFLRKLTEEVA